MTTRDASTQTSLPAGLAPLNRLGTNFLDVLPPELVEEIFDQLSLREAVPVHAAAKVLAEILADRIPPVMRLRASPFELTMRELLTTNRVLVVGAGNKAPKADGGPPKSARPPKLKFAKPLGDAGLPLLARALSRGALPSMTQLHLANNGLRDAGMSELGEAAQGGALASLAILDLEANK